MYTRSWRDLISGRALNDIHYKLDWVSQPSIKYKCQLTLKFTWDVHEIELY